METKEILIILKKIFYRCFFIGVLFLIFAAAIYLPCKCYIANVYQTSFGITPQAYYNFWAGFVGLIKTILIFFFLIPAFAIHLTSHEYNKKDSSKSSL